MASHLKYIIFLTHWFLRQTFFTQWAHDFWRSRNRVCIGYKLYMNGIHILACIIFGQDFLRFSTYFRWSCLKRHGDATWWKQHTSSVCGQVEKTPPDIFTDSKIAKLYKMGRMKSTWIINEALVLHNEG